LPPEEKDLIAYLDKEIEDYFVVEENSKIIAAAGINYFPKEKRLTFLGILLNLNHKEGKKLTEHRINYLNKNFKLI
jgi:N-acetylglutamate synthase-like GNAT family acetyltransferase